MPGAALDNQFDCDSLTITALQLLLHRLSGKALTGQYVGWQVVA